MARVHQVSQGESRSRWRTWRWRELVGYIFPAQWQALARDHRLTGQAFRLFLGLLPYVQWDNSCACTLTQAGRDVGLYPATVHRMTRQLIAARVLCITPHPSNPHRSVVYLSPALVWRGRPWHRTAAYTQYRARWRLSHGATHGVEGSEEASTPQDGTREGPHSPTPPLRTPRRTEFSTIY